MTKPRQIASRFVVMSDTFDADTVEVTDTMYAELDEKYNGFAGHLYTCRNRARLSSYLAVSGTRPECTNRCR